jgi:flavin reductase
LSAPREKRIFAVKKELSHVSPQEFKAAMRRFAANVNVITSADGNLMNGMTATAVCSVSAEPPSVLIIVNRTTRSHPIIKRSGAFAVNVLSTHQEDLATHFASKKDDPFASVDYRIGKTGCPIIQDSDAYIECVVTQEVEMNTHTIFVGEVVSTDVSDGEPLLYHAGRFRSLGSPQLAYA